MIPIFFSSYLPGYSSFNIVLREANNVIAPSMYGSESVEKDNIVDYLIIYMPSLSSKSYILFCEREKL